MSLNFSIINVLEKQIVNMQPMIQSQDNKISFLLVFCCLPVSQLEHFEELLSCLAFIFLGKFFSILLIILWVLSIFILLYSLYPKNKFEFIDPEINLEDYIKFLKEDYKKVQDILSKKINYVQKSKYINFTMVYHFSYSRDDVLESIVMPNLTEDQRSDIEKIITDALNIAEKFWLTSGGELEKRSSIICHCYG